MVLSLDRIRKGFFMTINDAKYGFDEHENGHFHSNLPCFHQFLNKMLHTSIRVLKAIILPLPTESSLRNQRKYGTQFLKQIEIYEFFYFLLRMIKKGL